MAGLKFLPLGLVEELFFVVISIFLGGNIIF
jgi:hypothetical protein